MAGFSRRELLAALPAAGLLSACATPRGISGSEGGITTSLVNGAPLDRVPAAGFVILDANGDIIASDAEGFASGLSAEEVTAGVPQRAFTIDTPLRAASVSKLATALTADTLAKKGVFDLDADIRTWWREFPRHPGWQEIAITPRHLLSHTSGLRDPEVYWMAHPGRIDTMIHPGLYIPGHKPGEFFEYCNFGYGILATLLEQAAGERFDRLAARLTLQPSGMKAGFNWAGVGSAERAGGATLYRETGEGWQIQTDGPDILSGEAPAYLIEDGASLSTYQPGQNGTLFSPQGGLRANLVDLARLAARAATAEDLTRPVWTLNAGETNGDHDQRYFTEFAGGVHLYPATESLWPGQRLLGHHGEAYGLYSGAWAAPDLGISFAYAVTGTPETPPARSPVHPALNRFTAPLMQAIRAA